MINGGAGIDAREDASDPRVWEGVSGDPVGGVIYYARTCCRIKIGFTADVNARMRQLSPDELLATEPGTFHIEAKRHRQFAADRIRGEWFHPSPALLAHIRALSLGHDSNRFVETDAAMVWTGRDARTLQRWAREGRITRHRIGSRTLWDVFELPTSNQPIPPTRAAREAVQERLRRALKDG